MATYDELTAEQKAVLQGFERTFRGWINGLARQLRDARALDAANQATGGAADIVALLDPGEVIPNTGGLAGAQQLEIADWNALIAGLNSFLSTYDTEATRRRIAQASGPTAGL